jgi:hypothetical protein
MPGFAQFPVVSALSRNEFTETVALEPLAAQR